MEIDVRGIKDVTFKPDFEANPEIIAALSMGVVKVEDYYQALLRQVQLKSGQILNKNGELTQGRVPESVLAFVMSDDGVNFDRSGVIALKPSVEPGANDHMAVEDPTIVQADGRFFVFHSAVKEKSGGGVTVSMQVATGDSLSELGEKQVVLRPEEVGRALGRDVDMIKEPEFIKMKNGVWRVFYEVAGEGKSRIATAESQSLLGPYKDHRILIDTREGGFDSKHVSPGPVMLTSDGDVLMFYNGCGNKSPMDETEKWSIGTVIIDANHGVLEHTRMDRPIIVPPSDLGYSGKLVAFASSLVSESGHEQKLYYHVADQRVRVARLGVSI